MFLTNFRQLEIELKCPFFKISQLPIGSIPRVKLSLEAFSNKEFILFKVSLLMFSINNLLPVETNSLLTGLGPPIIPPEITQINSGFKTLAKFKTFSFCLK